MDKNLFRIFTGVGVTLASIVGGVASADDDNNLDTIVITAQKMQEGSIGGWIVVPLPELPRTVTIVDEDTIAKQFVDSTKDILKNVPGVQIMPDNNLAGYQTPIIRGLQVNQYFEGQYSAGVITSIPEAIGSAEVLQGYNSLQIAVDTGGGSVNYFLKRPTAESFVQTDLRVTSWGGYKAIIDADQRWDTGPTDGVRFIGVLDRNQSFVRDSARNDGDAGSLIVRYSGLAGVTIDADFSYWNIKNEPTNQYISFTNAPNVASLPNFDPRVNLTQPWSEHAERDGHQIDVKLSRDITENWRALVAVAYDRTSYVNDGCTVSNPNFQTGEAGYSCTDSSFGPLWDKQDRIDLSGHFNIGSITNSVAMGWRQSGQFWHSLDPSVNFSTAAPYDTQNIYDPRTYPVPASGAVTPASYFYSSFWDRLTYLQDKIGLTPHWDLWAGVGYVEDIGDYGSPTYGHVTLPLTHAVTPTGAIVFKETDALNWYVSYAEGVSRNSIVTPGPNVANPGQGIPSLHSKAYEAGVKWTIASRLQLDAAVFHQTQPYTINQQITANPYTYAVEPEGLNTFEGINVDFHGKVIRDLTVQGGFTWLDPKQTDTQDPTLKGKYTPGVSRKSATLNATYDVAAVGGLSVDGGIYYQGSMPLTPENTYDLDGFTRVDLGATYQTIWHDEKVRFRLLIENALDSRFYYGFSNGLQVAAPRTFLGSVSVRW